MGCALLYLGIEKLVQTSVGERWPKRGLHVSRTVVATLLAAIALSNPEQSLRIFPTRGADYSGTVNAIDIQLAVNSTLGVFADGLCGRVGRLTAAAVKGDYRNGGTPCRGTIAARGIDKRGMGR